MIEEQPSNALSETVVNSGFVLKTRDSELEQSKKANFPISLTVLGILIAVKLLQPLNA